MLLGPLAFVITLGWVVVTSLDLSGATTPVPNPTVVTAEGGSTYVVFSEPSQKPCSILRDGSSKEPLESVDATENVTVSGKTYVGRGGFTTDTTRAVRVECPKSGPELLVIGVHTDGLGLKVTLLSLAALASFVIGLLMVIFRRKRPRY